MPSNLRRLTTLLAVIAGLLADPAAAPVEAAPPPCPAEATHPFADVDPSRTHAESVACLHALEITSGTSPDTYGYGDPVLHGQLATFATRTLDAADVTLPPPSAPWYEGESVHAAAINRLYEARILDDLEGYEPLARVTRAEMAVLVARILVHAEVLEEYTGEQVFDDVDDSAAADAIQRLGVAGVVNGDGEGAFRPDAVVHRAQMATFLVNALRLIHRDGEPLPEPPRVEVRTAPEGWLLAGGRGAVAGDDGSLVRYTVEIADGLQSRQPLAEFTTRVESTLSDPGRGWTARGEHRLQRVGDPADAEVRLLLASPETVDELCARAGLDTAGIYSCWTGRFAAINADRWFEGVAHVDDLGLYRTYVINHEVGHALGHGHVGCPGPGRLAPVMMQQTKRLDGCEPNGVPYP